MGIPLYDSDDCVYRKGNIIISLNCQTSCVGMELDNSDPEKDNINIWFIRGKESKDYLQMIKKDGAKRIIDNVISAGIFSYSFELLHGCVNEQEWKALAGPFVISGQGWNLYYFQFRVA